MLVIEHGHGPAGLTEGIGNFQEKLKARVELLPFFVEGIIAMLADQEHAIHGQLAGTQGEGVVNFGEDRDAVFFGALPAEVVRGNLRGARLSTRA